MKTPISSKSAKKPSLISGKALSDISINTAFRKLCDLQETFKEVKQAVEIENVGLRINKISANERLVKLEIGRLEAKKATLQQSIRLLIEEYHSVNHLEEVE